MKIRESLLSTLIRRTWSRSRRVLGRALCGEPSPRGGSQLGAAVPMVELSRVAIRRIPRGGDFPIVEGTKGGLVEGTPDV